MTSRNPSAGITITSSRNRWKGVTKINTVVVRVLLSSSPSPVSGEGGPGPRIVRAGPVNYPQLPVGFWCRSAVESRAQTKSQGGLGANSRCLETWAKCARFVAMTRALCAVP